SEVPQTNTPGEYTIEYSYPGPATNDEYTISRRVVVAQGYQLRLLNPDNYPISINPSAEYYLPGTEIEITAGELPGKRFDRWFGSFDSVLNPLVITISEDSIVSAFYGEALPPVIGFDPYVGRLTAGQSQSFAIDFEGTAPVEIKWTKNGQPMELATNTLELTNITPEDAGTYTITVSNEYGTATLDAVTLTVISPISIESQSESLNIVEGQQLSLGVTYTGTQPSEIQWFKDGVAIDGAISNIYLKSDAAMSDSGTYTAKITNEAGTTVSEPMVVGVEEYVAPPVITSFLVSPNVILVGSGITMSAAASGDGPFTFKWHKGDALLATTDLPIYSITEAAESDSGTYTVHVSNTAATVVSEPVSLQVLTPVAIETQPQDVSIAENAQFVLSVNATGSGEKSYRWYLDETLIEGASEATYSILQASSLQAGTYHVVVSNGASSIKSDAAQVVVVAPPVVTSFLVSPNVTLVGSGITMSAAASGDGPFTFKWHKGDALLATTDLPIYSITEAVESDSGTYTVHVSNTAATVVSEPVPLQVLTPVGIETQPQDAIVMERTPLELSVATVGSGELSFNWYLNDTPIEGATSAVYTVANATFADIGQYHVVVSNGASSAQSEKANILVTPFIEPPSIVIQPQSKQANLGEPSSMVVLAKGASPISYQWKLNGEEIAGAIGSFY
ncbi:immunoglobulin domain-containing protein, partial [Verrucomicrobia bacterium]|nr:immunoglobulin domain-containing protein [Verrucomicrobiota bacterium]